MTYEIADATGLQPENNRATIKAIFPFSTLEINQCFKVPNKAKGPPKELEEASRTIANMRNLCNYHNKANKEGKVFVCGYDPTNDNYIIVKREK